MSYSLNCAQCRSIGMVNGGLVAINRASHLCDPGSTTASCHMWAEIQLISIGLRGFFSGFSGFLPSSKPTLSHLHPAACGYPRIT